MSQRPPPSAGERIEARHPGPRWEPATVESVRVIDGHALVTAVTDVGASITTWWTRRDLRAIGEDEP